MVPRMGSWIQRHGRSSLARATTLLICGLLAGVIVAAVAFPAVALSGLAAKAGGESFTDLPTEVKDATTPQMSLIYASDNKTPVAVMFEEFRKEVPIKDISINMQHAIVAAEDHNFFQHNGVDLKGVARAIVSNNSGKSQQGASTLTMQVVRMSAAYSATTAQEVVDATADTPKRKISEMKYAMQLEKQLTKEQILERYLNIAPFGNRAYGIFAASQVYFNKSPKNLSVAESALLAGMVKAPTSNNPATESGYPKALGRRAYVIKDMVGLGYVTQADADKANKVPLSHTVKHVGNGCVAVKKNDWGFFCDYFYRWWLSQPTFGATTYDRERLLKNGGYRIVTSLDIKAQDAARKRISDEISDKNRNALLLAGIEPGTGRVRVLAANRKFKLDDPADPQNEPSSDPAKAAKNIRGTYPNTTNPILTGGGGINGYQAGSVFKMLTVVAALENGYPLAYPINTTYRYKSPTYLDSGAPAECNGHYCPTNASKSESGPYNMWTGFGSSVNTYFVPLEERVGAEKVVDVAKRFGVQFRADNDNELATKYAHDWGSFTLGVSSSTPLDMANAYATLAGDGMYCQPIPVQQITTLSGEKLDVGNPHCTRATSSDVARAALDAARCPIGDQAQLGSCSGHTTAGSAHGIIGHPIYGKTGTTDNDKTAALIIGSSSLTVAGYLVNPDYQNHSDRMSHDIVNPAVWYTMADYLKGKPKVEFKKPASSTIAVGDQRSIPDVTCASIDDARSRVENSGFTASTGAEVESDCPVGTAAGTDPSGTTVKGGDVSIQVSKGRAEQPVTPSQPPGGN